MGGLLPVDRPGHGHGADHGLRKARLYPHRPRHLSRLPEEDRSADHGRGRLAPQQPLQLDRGQSVASSEDQPCRRNQAHRLADLGRRPARDRRVRGRRGAAFLAFGEIGRMDLLEPTRQAFALLFSGDRELWGIIWLSLWVSVAALALLAPLCVPLGFVVARIHFPGRRALVVAMQGFLSFPTVVVGLVLYLVLSRRGPLGAFELLFTPSAILIGYMVIALPILMVFTVAAVQGADSRIYETARCLGARPLRAMGTTLWEGRFAVTAGFVNAFRRVLFDAASLELETGNGYVLIGPNGSGKTTLLRVLAGLDSAQEGKLVYRAREAAAAGPYPEPWRREIVYAHQQPYLFRTSLADNVEYGLARRGMVRERRAALAAEALAWAGLTARYGVPPHRLSGGEKHRAALARAKVLNPVLLLLDEPTANLDGEARAQVLELVRALITESHTVLIATHDPEIIRLAILTRLRVSAQRIEVAE